MKKILLSSLLILSSLTLCSCGKSDNQSAQAVDVINMVSNGEYVHNDDSMFIRHRLEDGYSILEERSTGVCYLEYYYKGGPGSLYGITAMFNPDGTAKVWER